jgi:L-rhamnose-H+ transport protein
MQLANGILFHAVGASSASLCYTPQKQVKGWSWQTYWLAQAAVCWLLMPILVAWLTIPNLGLVLQLAPSTAIWHSFLLGVFYGIGGTAFGMAIKHVGISLTYAIAVGISCILGTLVPPVLSGTMQVLLESKGIGLILTGVFLGAVGIAVCGIAGRKKELDLAKEQSVTGFSLAKGLPLCFLAGVLSAFYGFSLDAGQPIANLAEQYGAEDYKQNVIYLFSNSGAFLSTAIYCIYLHVKEGSFGEYGKQFKEGNLVLSKNFLMAIITGVLWYGQFFFYGLGHVQLGEYQFSSWAIHMIMLVLFSSIAGLILKEWTGCTSKTKGILAIALGILIAAVLILTYGNYLGGVN